MTPPAVSAERGVALLLCDERTLLAQVLRRTVADAGFRDVHVVRRWIEVVEHAAELRPDVVVIDLALAGHAGVQLVGALQAIAPSSPVIVVLPMDALDVGALGEHAAAVVDPSDLRPLGRTLRRIAAGDHPVG